MASIDPGAFIRLKKAIDATLADDSERAFAAKALSDAYAGFWPRARELAETQGVVAEFDGYFPRPAASPSAPSVGRGFDPFASSAAASEAASLLRGLSGWLDGFVEIAQMELNAAAYALRSDVAQKHDATAWKPGAPRDLRSGTPTSTP